LTSADPAGLRIGSDGRGMVIIRDGVPVATGVRPPAGCGTLAVHFTAAATTISADQTIFAAYGGDRRSRVSGFFANPQAQAGLRARVVADTQFDTSSSLIKWIIGALSILFLVLALDGVRGIDNSPGRPKRARPSCAVGRLRRLRVADLFVVASLPVWSLIGPPTPDDGYIMEIIQGRSATGLISNYAH